jgi:bifunctional non-homologous end joining protein LigD
MAQDALTVDVGGHRVRITTPERVLYPRTGFTKARMLEYYASIAPVLLPHVVDRPLTLRRFPEGVEGPTWYQTRCGANHPDYVTTCVLTVPGGDPQDYCVLHDAAGLLWAANRSTVELHPLLMRADEPESPTSVVFDLDPGPGVDLLACCRVALVLRDALEGVGMRSFVKTSGSVGIHVVAPLNTPATFGATKDFARLVARTIRASMPNLVVDRQARDARAGRVLVDWLQNDRRRSTVAPYSLRAARAPVVSMPLAWDEVERALATSSEAPLWYSPRAALERADAVGDPFSQVQTLRQELPSL